MPENLMGDVIAYALAFFMGAIPFGPIFARRRGVDLRATGSGNIGATNVLRSVGKAEAVLTLLGDALKGTAAVALGGVLGLGLLGQGACGILAVLGHNYSPFLGFRGGKGVATSLGVVLIYAPKAGILTLALWLLAARLSRMSSAGALVSFALCPVLVLALGYPGEQAVAAAALGLLIYVRHADNIKRILSGTERRIGEKS